MQTGKFEYFEGGYEGSVLTDTKEKKANTSVRTSIIMLAITVVEIS
jgi:hypothetical protein